ncbi:MAG: outer membrane porin, OprD family [Campylobacterales bacterium]|nr:outer membrane porin, OprD family [Campylobacterales bacterium]
MKRAIKCLALSLVAISTLQAADLSGFVKYMNAGAQNQDKTIDKESSVLGIELGISEQFSDKFSGKITGMSVEALGDDNSCRRIIDSKAYNNPDGFTVLGEAYIKYEDDNSEITVGRQKINTPLIASNPTGMTYQTLVLSGTFEALRYQKELDSGSIDFSMISKYKQRTSDKFYDLGENITGNTTALDMDYVAMLGYSNSIDKNTEYQLWALKAENLTNTFYGDINYKMKSNGVNIDFAIQGLDQSIDSNQRNIVTTEATQQLNESKTVDDSSLVGAKVSVSKNGSKLMLAATKTGDNQIILPWDGTPAFTKICVTNGLTRSIKGKGLTNYAGAYAANTNALKLAYIQDFSKFGVSGLKSVIAYAKYDTKAATVDQSDKMIYLTYELDGKLKGLTATAAYTKIDNFNADTWIIEDGQEYEHYKLILTYSF